MKRIILIRHGKAAMAGKDHERELDEDGIIQASSLKNKLIELGLNNARIYTSSFKRAIQTIKPFAAMRVMGLMRISLAETMCGYKRLANKSQCIAI